MLQNPALVGARVATDNAALATVMLDMHKYFTAVVHILNRQCHTCDSDARHAQILHCSRAQTQQNIGYIYMSTHDAK